LGLPDSAEKPLRDLIAAMRRYDFSQLKEDIIGQIMEGLIPPAERHALGQYFTREDLVDFILGFVAKTEKAYYLDPTCGSGIFLVRLYHRLSWLSKLSKEKEKEIDHASLLERLWGVDVAHFPAELATINLFRQNTRDYTNFPRILVRDFFELSPGQKVEFPPLRSTGLPYEKIQLPFPQFDGIVGNFPYIRQEIIERQKAGYKKELIRAIARYWLWKDPKLFRLKKTAQKELRTVPPAERDRWLEEALKQNQIKLRLSGKADIYAYLFYHAAAFLKEKGRMGIVTSNAWLDVAYGLELKRFFLRHFKIIAIVASWAEPWFVDAAINTAFVILERCEDKTEREKHQVAFVKMRKPLKDILPQDLLLQADKRWNKVDALVRQIEGAPDEANHLSRNTLEKPDMHIRLIPQKHLQDQLTQKKENAKWGLYIRAPQVYFDILEKAGPNLIPLSEVAEVRYGVKTGLNDFFFLTRLGLGKALGTLEVKNARDWKGEIEAQFLKPILTTLKEITHLEVNSETLDTLLFLCDKDEETLRKDRYVKALSYIKWGEDEETSGKGRVGKQGIPFPKVKSVRSHKPQWFNLTYGGPGHLISNCFIGKRFGFLVNTGVAVSNTFFEISFKSEAERDIYAALLNSTLTYLFLEVAGRQTWSQGVLYIYGPELSNLLVPNLDSLDKRKLKTIQSKFEKLKKREVFDIQDEVKQADRQDLDNAVLDALDLDPKVYLRPLYDGLVELVTERLELSKMRAARPKAEKRLSDEKLLKQWEELRWPERLKPITTFLEGKETCFLEIPLREKQPVRYPKETPGLFSGSPKPVTLLNAEGEPVSSVEKTLQVPLLNAEGKPVGWVETISQARYAVLAAKPQEYLVRVPADEKVLKEVLEAYEAHLREEGGRLLGDIQDAVLNVKKAKQLFQSLLERAGLPPSP